MVIIFIIWVGSFKKLCPDWNRRLIKTGDDKSFSNNFMDERKLV